MWMHYMEANKTTGEKAWQQLHNNAANNIEQILEVAPNKAADVWPPTTYHENYQNYTKQTCGTLLEKWFTHVDPFTWPSKSRMTSSNLHTAALCWYGM